jgi:IS30 family transposase
VQAWSPEQISNRLQLDFPEDVSMRISHEAIYQALYVQSRGALRRELVACLRTGRALRVPRARAKQKAWAHVTPEVMISERPAEVEDRAVPGHWEGDLLIGLERSAIGTLVERTTRFTMLIHLPREDGYGVQPRVHNGPALAGYGAVTMKNALASTMTTLPADLRRSLTWDRGKELSAHATFKVETGIPVYFADPHSPWQRGTNENTNGLLRQYFPKGTDLSRWNAEEVEAVAAALNGRPRRISDGARPPKPSTSTYAPCNQPVLLRSIEPGQFTSWAFTRRTIDSGLLPSMGSIGDCYDDAVIESFWSRMQVELLDRKRWRTRVELANASFEYLEIFHNRQRRHLACSHRSSSKPGINQPQRHESSLPTPPNPGHPRASTNPGAVHVALIVL